jgi:hypothetical protein
VPSQPLQLISNSRVAQETLFSEEGEEHEVVIDDIDIEEELEDRPRS